MTDKEFEKLKEDVNAAELNPVKRFAQSNVEGNKSTWIEYKDGTKKESKGDIIHALWFRWVESENAIRYREGDWLVFGFKEKQ